ncbi:hypothetical protein AB0K53_00605 [Streptomyces tuirus]|uniref:hypothetical protein n=1 Tax=Streptomyces tuirus TaxID=68278 RepID=UPI00341BFF27
MGDHSDFLSSLPRLPLPSPEEMERAREEERRRPPLVTTLPAPDFVPGGIARFHCALRCGWYHDEAPGLEPMGLVRVPVGFTPEELSAAISAQAEARAEQFRRRVESAIAAHFASAHPDH